MQKIPHDFWQNSLSQESQQFVVLIVCLLYLKWRQFFQYQTISRRNSRGFLKSGSLEEVHHATPWCSRALCVQKPGSPDEDPSVRMVTNLQKVNQAIKRIGYPMDGAFHNLRRLNPQNTCFSVVDLCQGFHQIRLAEENRDLFKKSCPTQNFVIPVCPRAVWFPVIFLT